MVSATADFFDEAGVKKQLTYYPEYGRYCTFFFEDIDSRVSALVSGGMEFRVPEDDELLDPEDPLRVDKTRPASIPDMVVPDQKFIIRWYQVPARYLSSPNSYLIKYKGFINQWSFVGKIIGSLLYMGSKILRFYTPPQYAPGPQPPLFDGFTDLHAGTFFAEQLCDIELHFIYTMRKRNLGNPPDPNSIPALERPNPNWIDGPHNWMPHFQTRRYFYVHASTEPANDYAHWQPYYFSIPHQILFQDPDVPGQVVVIP